MGSGLTCFGEGLTSTIIYRIYIFQLNDLNFLIQIEKKVRDLRKDKDD